MKLPVFEPDFFKNLAKVEPENPVQRQETMKLKFAEVLEETQRRSVLQKILTKGITNLVEDTKSRELVSKDFGSLAKDIKKYEKKTESGRRLARQKAREQRAKKRRQIKNNRR